MIDKSICLIGFMGSGKSSVARRLGALCKRRVFSTDQMVEQEEGRSIDRIFKELGEEHFRSVERKAVEAAAKEKSVIIDCGGGVVLDPRNIEDLKRTGIIIYLSASAEFLYEKVKSRTHRPLLNVADPLAKMQQMLKDRAPLYRKADYEVVSENKTIEQIAQEIMGLVKP